MSDETYRPVTVSRRIEAPAGRLFELLADPANHQSIDGSGMLQGLASGEPMDRVGSVFRMKMHHVDMGHYTMENTVVDFEPDRHIVWEPARVGADGEDFEKALYQWGWVLEPQSDGATLVTETFDCSRSPQWLREATQDGDVWREAMAASLERLEALAASAG